MAQGEFSVPCDAKRLTNFPPVVNSSMYPLPAPATSSCFAPSCSAYETKIFPWSDATLNGAKPVGIFGSVNVPGNVAAPNDELNTSIAPLLKLAAYRNDLPCKFAMVAPL